FFGAANQEAEAAKIVGVGFAGVAVEESVGAEKNGAVQLVDERGNHAVVQRGRIKKNVTAAGERQEQAHEAETMEKREGVEKAVAIDEVERRNDLAHVGGEVAVGEFNAFGRAFGAAGEKDDSGVLGADGGFFEGGGVENGAEEGHELGGARDGGADIFEADELNAGVFHGLDVEAGAFEEFMGRDDAPEVGEAGAGEHGGGAGGIIENGGDFIDSPKAEERDRHGVGVGEEDTDVFAGSGAEARGPLAREGVGAGNDAAVSQAGVGDVLERGEGGPAFGGFKDGGGNGGRGLFEFHFELLAEHGVVEPASEFLPGLDGGDVGEFGRGQERAEMGGDGAEVAATIAVGRPGEARGAAQIAGEDAGAPFVKQKTSAFVELHERAGGGEAAFGEKNEFAPTVEVLGDALDSIRRLGFDREGVPVDHDEAVDGRELGRFPGGDEFPVVVQADGHEPPIEPGDVVGEKNDRAFGAEVRRVEGAEAKKQARKDAEEGSHEEKRVARETREKRKGSKAKKAANSAVNAADGGPR